jgi:two-component system, NarL family, response regulator
MTAAKEKIRILIADDHAIVRSGIAAIIGFQPDMEIAGEAENGKQAVELFQKLRPDVGLLDLRMPEMDGAAAIKLIRRDYPHAALIVLTTFDGDEDIFRALKAGAKSYLLKDTPREELLEAIRAVYAGRKFVTPEIALKLADRIAGNDLTPRELQILQGIGGGLANKEIARSLNISEGTVKIHVNNIFSKLNVADRTQAALTAIKRGILKLE